MESLVTLASFVGYTYYCKHKYKQGRLQEKGEGNEIKNEFYFYQKYQRWVVGQRKINFLKLL